MEVSVFSGVPREVTRRKEWIEDEDLLWRRINDINGHEDCYVSIYRFRDRAGIKQYGDAIESSAIVDKVFFDFDCKYGYDLMRECHRLFTKKNILHRINHSGKYIDGEAVGFHIYVFLKKEVLQYKKCAVSGFQRMIDRYLLSFLHRKYEKTEVDKHLCKVYRTTYPRVVDPTIIGDLVRISRVPNTWNPTKSYVSRIWKNRKWTDEYERKWKIRNIFCIPMTEQTIELSAEEIHDLARKPFENGEKFYLGKKLISIKKWDTPTLKYKPERRINAELIQPNFEILKKTPLPYCIRAMMSREYLNNKERFWFIVLLRDWGLTSEEIDNCLESFLNPRQYSHCVEPRNFLNIKVVDEEIIKLETFNPNIDAGEDMIYRCIYGNQRNAYFPGGCNHMKKMSVCAKDLDLECSYNHPVYF